MAIENESSPAYVAYCGIRAISSQRAGEYHQKHPETKGEQQMKWLTVLHGDCASVFRYVSTSIEFTSLGPSTWAAFTQLPQAAWGPGASG